jgi:hypothetical protein
VRAAIPGLAVVAVLVGGCGTKPIRPEGERVEFVVDSEPTG